jgi:ribosomal protein S18 acetylase RimI-like enzyme
MNDPYTIRPAREADLDRLTELGLALQDHLEACNPGLWKMTAEGRANLKGQLAGRLRAAGVRVLVAEHERDGVIGVIYGRIVTNNRYVPFVAGSIDQAFVTADHRRAGVGTRLVAELCRFFAAARVEELTVRYVVDNPEAAGFWTALGFEPRIVTTGASRQAVEDRLDQFLAL